MAPQDEQPTTSVLRQAVEDGSRLVQQEVQLAKQELTESIHSAVTALIGAVVALVCLIACVVMAIVTIVAAVSPHWAAAAGFCVLFLVLAAVGALLAVRHIRSISPMRQTVDSVKENLQWAKQQLTRDAS